MLDSIRQLHWDPRKALIRSCLLVMFLFYVMSLFEVNAKKDKIIIRGKRRKHHHVIPVCVHGGWGHGGGGHGGGGHGGGGHGGWGDSGWGDGGWGSWGG